MNESLVGNVRQLLAANALDDARRMVDAARVLDPEHVEVLRADAFVHFGAGEDEQAVASLGRAVELDPGDVALREEYAELLASAGFGVDAVEQLRELVARAPDWRRWFALGRLLYEQWRESDAADAFEQASLLGAPDEVVQRALAESLFSAERFDAAVEHFDALAAKSPHDVELALRTVQARARGGDLEGAASALQFALARHPRDPRLALARGRLEEDRGDAERARSAYREAAAGAPGWPEPVAALLMLDHREPSIDVVAQAESMLAHGHAPQETAYLRYALGKVADAAGRHDEAWSHWSAANALRRIQTPEEAPGVLQQRVDALRSRYTPAFVSAAREGLREDGRPVLVVGMPRSGTTLVEQILAAHPSVHGAGELPTLAQMHEAVEAELAAGTAPDFSSHATRYVERLARDADRDAERLVDKQPYNFFFLGLAAALLPGARVIWCRRDPRDVAVSIFSENFSARSRYATDASDIRELHEAHLALMQHWRETLDIEVLEVQYEQLVHDFEPTVREMLGFLELPWNASCLEFHKSGRAVQTNSRWQVRQPLHARSVGRWRNYVGALAAAGFEVD